MNAPDRTALRAIAGLPDSAAVMAAALSPAHGLDAAYSADLMPALFELTSVGIQLIDLGRQVSVAVNPALVRITGYSNDELMQGDPCDRFPAGCQAVRDGWHADVMAHGRFGPAEVEYVHKGGHLINLVFSGVRVTDPRGRQFLWLNVQDVTSYRALERELRIAANQDRLTGLANRNLLLRELQALVERAQGHGGAPFAVLFLDFDRFKLVNDTLGHDAGDELLCAIAGRLRAVAQAGARHASNAWLAARLGGDEFVVLVPGVADEAAACVVAMQLQAVLAAPYSVRQQAIHSSASIGIAHWQGDGASAEAMLRDADIAMYEAKRRGRGNFVVYDQAMRARLTRAMQLEGELRHAVARQQLQVVYQPIVDLETGLMSAVEALLRWTHPTLGAVPPLEFIPLAEESGQIVELGAWVLQQACLQWAAWQRQHGSAAPAMVSVNLSRVQLAVGQRLLATVQDALAAAAMPPAALQLEITEREVMKDPAAARALMQALAGLGVHLAMDDFGTGTSSLACLRDYPFHTIKIHRSFVTGLSQDPHVLAVAHATVSVIENLGMASVAEGIEDPSEVATLQALGCRYGQGLWFAPAVPAEQVLGALAGRPAG